MNKAISAYLCITMLLIGSFIGLPFSLSEVNPRRNEKMITLGDGIVLNGTDYNSTITFEYPPDLNNVTKGVTSRIVAEYGDFVVKKDLYRPDGLPTSIYPRITAEYADTASQLALQSPQGLNQSVNARIIIEYADYGSITGFLVPSLDTDLNGDGVVNVIDIFVVARAFGTELGDSKWNPIADLDRNGMVNIVDIFRVAKDFGKKGLLLLLPHS